MTAADRTEIAGPALVQVVGNTVDVRTGEPFRWRHRMASLESARYLAEKIRAERPEWTVTLTDERGTTIAAARAGQQALFGGT